jgi:bifunctional non-homologous end joining protein LigD
MATAKKKTNAARKGILPKTPAQKGTSDAIDKQLAKYQSMRDFSVTSEPSGACLAAKKVLAKNPGLPFVIQKHAASHLHYDFRLAWNGVLKSWACARGLSYYPGDRRLAVQVEDHPMEYGGFEGIIPQGQYGGGTVMLWDEGTWEPQPGHTDVNAGLRDGSLKFTLRGKKMKGNWTLVRMTGKAAREKKPNWLLIKEHDSYERGEGEKMITEESPNSVVTGRSLEQIALEEDHMWNSKDTAKGNARHRKDSKQTGLNGSTHDKAEDKPSLQLSKLPKEPLPDFIPPQLATQAASPPTSAGWLNELKLDGYRIQARVEDGNARLLTRSGLDWTHRMSALAEAVAQLPAKKALLDGEVVVLSEDGNTSFADLQASFQDGVAKPLTYFLFDLLHLNGRDLRKLPLHDRKGSLAQLLQGADPSLQLCEHLDSDASTVLHRACELHAEGIICKRADAPYTSGRSSSWLKLKCVHEQEFVVGGFTLPAKGHSGIHGIGSLLLGYYNDAKKLSYAGRTGTGFSQKTHALLRTQLEGLRQSSNPFFTVPADARHSPIWVKPTLVAQVRFATWTADNLVRQASFQGIREDKPAAEVRREESSMKPQTVRKTDSATRESQATPSPVLAKAPSVPTKAAMEHPPIRLTHPEKIVDAESQLTKQQLADYYWAIAPYILPQIVGRPLSLVRCPEGSTKTCFFQKHTTQAVPAGIETVQIPDKKTGKLEPYITISTPEAVASLAQMGVLEVHPWSSRNEDLEHPDRIIFDLDPDAAISWRTLADAADEVRKRMSKIGLKSFLKSTGGKGLHIVVPIQPGPGWPSVKQFAHSFVRDLERSNPTLYLTKMSKAARAGKIYLDYLRNERGATAVSAFSPRARTGAPVSLPLRWEELKLKERPAFHVSDYSSWKQRLKRDPWKDFASVKQKLAEDIVAGL